MIEGIWLQATGESVQKTIAAMAGVPVEIKEKKEVCSLDPLDGTISSLLDFDGTEVSGRMLLSFPPSSFKMIVEKILQEEIVIEKNYSFASEMLNMIYGGVKTTMNKSSYGLGLARPSLVLEKSQLPAVRGYATALIPCFIEEGKGFFIVLMLKEKA